MFSLVRAAGQISRASSKCSDRLGHSLLSRSFATKPGESNIFRSRFLKDPKTVRVIGCPFSGGQSKPGVDQGPIHLVEAGLLERIESLGWKVEFNGHHQFEDIKIQNDPPNGIVKRPKFVSKVCEALAAETAASAAKGELPVTLGGDHSLAMGTIAGTLSKYPDATVIWVDAHADINTPTTTPSGNIHGMPMSFLLGLQGCSDISEFSWIQKGRKEPIFKAHNLVYIGLRDVDVGEKQLLRDNGIKAFSMHEVDKFGIGKVVEMALDHVNPHRDKPIHLTFDVDALDPSVAPSTGTPVRGGLTFREGHYICEAVAETGLLVGLDLMEVNPSLLDPIDVQKTVSVGCSLVGSALGETLL